MAATIQALGRAADASLSGFTVTYNSPDENHGYNYFSFTFDGDMTQMIDCTHNGNEFNADPHFYKLIGLDETTTKIADFDRDWETII